jgi:hypothetical protein
MKLEWAVLAGAALIAGAIAITNHWQIELVPQAGVLRLDRWTGKIDGCTNDNTANAPRDGRYSNICR